MGFLHTDIVLSQPVNDEPPLVLGEKVVVEKGMTVAIHNQSLFISDIDSGAENLMITVKQLPQHGKVIFFVVLLKMSNCIIMNDTDVPL